jgi:hypothetical protein
MGRSNLNLAPLIDVDISTFRAKYVRLCDWELIRKP